MNLNNFIDKLDVRSRIYYILVILCSIMIGATLLLNRALEIKNRQTASKASTEHFLTQKSQFFTD